jgi:signal transduction histidine kinase
MKKEILLAALGYFFSIVLLLSFLYWFLLNEGFGEETFLVGSAFVLLLSAGWGYIIASGLIAPRRKREAHLLHLTKDIIHEINLPLSTIKANIEMLAKKTEDERTRKRLGRIESATVRLNRLYEELLYAMRKEMHTIEKERFLLPKLIEERIEIFREQQRNPIAVDVEACTLIADRIGFEQMFDNLVSNAMKYSPKDAPLHIVYRGGILKIVDRGVGMDETELVRIFERYYQSDDTKKGEGIGLALVKAYCDSEGIGIQVTSQKGEGTEVVLDLHRIIAYTIPKGETP